MKNLASVMSNQGYHHEALANYRKILEIEKRVCGTDSIPVALTLHSLGIELFDMGLYEEALENFDLAHANFLLLTKGEHAWFSLVVAKQQECHEAIAKRDALAKKKWNQRTC